jgi:BlaI family penicillinase repressor
LSSRHSLGELQFAIMRVLWDARAASVAEVHQGLGKSHGRAPTTIATMLSKMERKGVVRHRTEGRRFIYVPAVSEDEVRRSMTAELAARLFEGHYFDLVTYLLDEQEFEDGELEQLKQRISRRARPEE